MADCAATPDRTYRAVERVAASVSGKLTTMNKPSQCHRADTAFDLRSFPTNKPRGVSNDIP
jgi:hypothetical protein